MWNGYTKVAVFLNTATQTRQLVAGVWRVDKEEFPGLNADGTFVKGLLYCEQLVRWRR